VFLDCRTNVARVLPFPSGYALVIADSGVKHSLVQGEYNMRREQCAAAARSLGVAALRDVDSALLSASTLNPLIKRRAAHVVGENERVLKAIERLAVNDGEGFGALMNASHESSRVNFENSAPALDLLVQIARSLPGVLGARLTGGGFGGSTVNLTREGTAAEVAKLLSAEYSRRSGNSPQVFVCRLAEGAH
jgi:galactokinase